MPTSLQQEMIAVMQSLGVDASGVVRGPVTAEAVRRATELSSRLDQAGYPEAGAAMRGYAQQASKMLPAPATPAPAIPGVPPALMAQIQRALELERDPAKLEALRTSLAVLPQSPERDMLVGALDALILQIRSAQAISQAATAIDQMTQPGGVPATPTPIPTVIPALATTSTRILKLVSPNMKGEDVRAWQLVLLAAGYTLGKGGADGVFGPDTDLATKDWQKKRGLEPDGDVGPATRAAIGRPPTAPLAVPATASPQPDPKPKTALEVAAEAVAVHLLQLQSKYGVAGSKGRQDLTLVKRFQTAAGATGKSVDGLPGPGTMVALAKAGIGKLPGVMYWPKAGTKAKDLPAYRSQLNTLAQAARSRGLVTLAAQLEASAAAEAGAGGLK
jgi:peptidoglycan hydrolase-like protein with peptidoglycan-binding domain